VPRIQTFGENLKVFPVPEEPKKLTNRQEKKKEKKRGGTTTVVLGTPIGVHPKPKTLRRYLTNTLIEIDSDWSQFAFELSILEGIIDGEKAPPDDELEIMEDSVETLESSLHDLESKAEALIDLGVHFGITRAELVRCIPKMNQSYANFIKALPLTDSRG
jgi:hypothetical protein